MFVSPGLTLPLGDAKAVYQLTMHLPPPYPQDLAVSLRCVLAFTEPHLSGFLLITQLANSAGSLEFGKRASEVHVLT